MIGHSGTLSQGSTDIFCSFAKVSYLWRGVFSYFLLFISFQYIIFIVFVFDKISKGMLVTIEGRAGGIFSKITFLKSVGSTDQNAL